MSHSSWSIDWKKALWDRLVNDEIRSWLETRTENAQKALLSHMGSVFLTNLGWIAVCSGCETPYNESDCDCSVGSSWWPPEDILMELDSDRPNLDDIVRLVRYIPGFTAKTCLQEKVGKVSLVDRRDKGEPTVVFEGDEEVIFSPLRPYRLLGLQKVL